MSTPDFGAARWRKSSRSNGEQACVELAFARSMVCIRDSKNPNGGHLDIDHSTFVSFLARVKAGRLNRR
jgi:Domain of unknown function (DUF397)